ncbi:hypothetical protein [Solemya velum gill symbiont]|uniref:hypothetical protein n=1 Tax=Solemya velum gill symbiont TaxID=2340 RepID=UPI0009981D10|nr:hypothetical protein [Solemya velum gill symbiont]OOZ43261.1 hypothetical protein BOW37_11845 [Solemya velum gill symbiont]OOZ44150.1 hypothetical protein BOW38_11925 [Solemya velum gill symbiont]OOZ48099.1 hypothetical protein BOW39_12435 [Solemya velum gill symbiont]OOZ49280.1 hypothetical protein BOW40_12000 [Solemya velum gill symbiont]OOZ53049.1 hypothetical protein BOW41_12025 [Solemya velum gill symbiont]
MAYENKVDDLVGNFVAEFQRELITARNIESYLDDEIPKLVAGYPDAVYHPKEQREPVKTQFIAQTAGRLSNGVPRVLSAEIINGYPLGVYFPR